MQKLQELITILERIHIDASLIKANMLELDKLNLSIREQMTKVENSYRRLTIELFKLKDEIR